MAKDDTAEPTGHATYRITTVQHVPVDPNLPTILGCRVEIECTTCGVTELAFFGHHVQGLITCLAKIAADHPDLTGDVNVSEPVPLGGFTTRGGGDPRNN